MDQLHTIERLIELGDVNGLQTVTAQLTKSTDLDEIYEAAGMLMAYGFVKEADSLYAALLVHLPEEAQLKIDRAETLLELGEEDEALLLLTDIKAHEDEYVQALLSLADYYQMAGMAEAALSKIQEAYSINPHEPVIRFAYAELLLDAGKYAEAVRHYEHLLEETDEIGGISIAARLAETYSAGAAYEEALPYYEQLLKGQAAPDDLFGGAFAYYQTKQYERAVRLLEELIEADPDYFSAYMLAGQSYAMLDDDNKAYELFTAGIRRDSFDKELQLAAGKAALKLGDQEQAERHLEEALALDPEYIEPLLTLASIYNEQEKDEQLIDLFLDQKDEMAGIPLLYSFLAYAYERLEQFDEAYVFYSKAYDGMKEEFGFLDKFARFLLEEGRKKEAVAIVNEIVELFPEDENWRAFAEAQIDEEV